MALSPLSNRYRYVAEELENVFSDKQYFIARFRIELAYLSILLKKKEYTSELEILEPFFHHFLSNNPKTIEDRDVVINRTDRWIPEEHNPQWSQWRSEGIEQRAVFIGLEDEYLKFKAATGWDIPYQKTRTLLEVAEYIAGAGQFIGNQSAALAVAIGLGHPSILCEARRDLPRERNECYFSNRFAYNKWC